MGSKMSKRPTATTDSGSTSYRHAYVPPAVVYAPAPSRPTSPPPAVVYAPAPSCPTSLPPAVVYAPAPSCPTYLPPAVVYAPAPSRPTFPPPVSVSRPACKRPAPLTPRRSALPTTSYTDPAPGTDNLPEICWRHGSRAGCEGVACRRLHLCSLFLAGICKFGTSCRNSHSLSTVHNQMVRTNHGLGSISELVLLQRLKCAFDRDGGLQEATYRRNLEVCFRFNSARSCNEPVCHRLHICKHFVLDLCNWVSCKYGHSLHTSHNNDVLSRHRVIKLTDNDIIALLREKTQLHPPGPTAAGSGPVRPGPQRQRVRHGRQPQQHRRDGGAGAGGAGAGGPGAGGAGAGGAGASGADMSEELQCAVCLDLLNRATTLGCGHTFCAGCVQQLRDSDPTCPMCRAHITTWARSVVLDNIISNIASQQ